MTMFMSHIYLKLQNILHVNFHDILTIIKFYNTLRLGARTKPRQTHGQTELNETYPRQTEARTDKTYTWTKPRQDKTKAGQTKA